MLTRRRMRMSSLPLRASMFSPSMSIWPSVGVSRRLMQRMSVDLPAPLMPMMPYISPFSIFKLTPPRATTSPPGTG